VLKKKIGIINYKAGNIYSIKNSFEYLGCEVNILEDINKLKNIEYLVLPGVGSFGHCVTNLSKNFSLSQFKKIISKNRIPLLCICVGMQMLGDTSEESPGFKGLNIFDFNVFKMKEKVSLKLPHVGWNDVRFESNFGSFKKNHKYDFYFDHSYIVKAKKLCVGVSEHNEKFCSIIQSKNILACQFHPEKSQDNGINFLKTFLDLYA
jgi:glutamine amidotransferase